MKITGFDYIQDYVYTEFSVKTDGGGYKQIRVGDVILYKTEAYIDSGSPYTKGIVINITQDVIIMWNYYYIECILLKSDYDLALIED